MTLMGVNKRTKETIDDLRLVEMMGREAMNSRIPISVQSNVFLIPNDRYIEGLSGDEDMIRVNLTDKKAFEHYELGNDRFAKEHELLAYKVALLLSKTPSDAHAWELAKAEVLARDIEEEYPQAPQRAPSQGLIQFNQEVLYGERPLQDLARVLRSFENHEHSPALILEDSEGDKTRTRAYRIRMKEKYDSTAWAEGKTPKASDYTQGRLLREFRRRHPYNAEETRDATTPTKQQESSPVYARTTGPNAATRHSYDRSAPVAPRYNGSPRADAEAFAAAREMSRITLAHHLRI